MKTIRADLLLTLASLLVLTPQATHAQIWHEALGTNAQPLHSTDSSTAHLGTQTLSLNTTRDRASSSRHARRHVQAVAEVPTSAPASERPATRTEPLALIPAGGQSTTHAASALLSNTPGDTNTPNGRKALYPNSDGFSNTA